MKDSDWEILHELYKNPNMTKVANLLYISQPSLTKRLQQMESEFRITIVNRTPKGLEFTPEGKYLAEQAKRYMEFLNETKARLEEMKGNVQGSILIGSSYTYSKYTLIDVLTSYKAHHPNTNFEVVNEQSNILFRRMLEGAIDVGFIRGDYEGSVNKVLVARNEAYLVTKEPVALDDILNMQYIGYKTNDRSHELLDDWWEERFGVAASAGIFAGYVDVAWQLVGKGLGYTCCFLPDHFQNEYHLCLTPLEKKDGSKVIRNTWFVYSKNKRMSDTLEEFIDYIKRNLALR